MFLDHDAAGSSPVTPRRESLKPPRGSLWERFYIGELEQRY